MRAYLELDMNALTSNYEKIKAESKKEVIAVLKSNAYGHGLLECARQLVRLKVPMIAVATIEEAIAIRKSLIFCPILLLGECLDYKLLSSYRIVASILSLSHLEKLRQSPYPIQVHLAIDTGMFREGILLNEISSAKELLAKSKLQLTGIFTHYSSLDAYEKEQAIFSKALEQFKHKERLMIHSSCSSTYRINHSQDTHIRIGLSLFGLDQEHLPILKMYAPIIRKRAISKGTSVGYQEKGIAPQNGYVYTIALGYADGWPRNYQTKAYFGQHTLTQIGNTCMDYLMLFSEESITEDSLFTLIDEDHPAQEIAQEQQTIVYEVVARLSPRLKRIIKKKSS